MQSSTLTKRNLQNRKTKVQLKHMDLPINDEELATVITALKLGGDTALHNKLLLVKELKDLGKPYKKILREQYGYVV